MRRPGLDSQNKPPTIERYPGPPRGPDSRSDSPQSRTYRRRAHPRNIGTMFMMVGTCISANLFLGYSTNNASAPPTASVTVARRRIYWRHHPTLEAS